MTTTRFLVMTLLLCLLPMTPAVAHPHAWIDITTRVVLNDKGHIIAIEEEWLFDEIYSAFVIEDVEGEASREALNELAGNNLLNLKEYEYFTDIRQGDKKVILGTAETWESEMRKDRLWMQFTVPLAYPIDPSGGHVRYAVYDPSYWIEMAYGETDEATIVTASAGASAVNATAKTAAGNPQGCFLMQEPPVVTSSMLALAFSLDRDEQGPSNLGAQFATWVKVLCP